MTEYSLPSPINYVQDSTFPMTMQEQEERFLTTHPSVSKLLPLLKQITCPSGWTEREGQKKGE